MPYLVRRGEVPAYLFLFYSFVVIITIANLLINSFSWNRLGYIMYDLLNLFNLFLTPYRCLEPFEAWKMEYVVGKWWSSFALDV